MKIGQFSLSLNVKDIAVSREFYEKIGFEKFFGDQDQGWLIMDNGDCTIGLFQGMLEKNTFTFNPGWGERGAPVEEFEDIRDIQKRFKNAEIKFASEADESTQGPASFIVTDPDGNPILVDQHR